MADEEATGGMRIAALGDLHVKETHTGSDFRELFAEVSKAAEALVLCGDLTDTGTKKQADILAENLKACSIPVIGVLGNHDYESGHVDDVRDTLRSAGM
jgi:predicted MPP superfamily phosphohydrolase